MKARDAHTMTCPHCSGAIVVTAKTTVTIGAGDPPAAPKTVERDATKADAQWLQEAWNQHKHRKQIASLGALNPALRAEAMKRCREIVDKADWIKIVQFIAAWKFAYGEECGSDGRKWVAGFQYLVRPKTAANILDRVRHRETHGDVPMTAQDARTSTRARNVAHVATERVYRPGEDA